MNIPQVEFSIPPLNKILPVIHYFLNRKGWDWSDTIYKNYPALKNKLNGIKDEKKRWKIEYKQKIPIILFTEFL